MSSKIPKSSFKPVFGSRALGTIAENGANRPKEAPASFSRVFSVPGLRRRSKSVTDLRSVISQPLTDFRALRSQNLLKKDVQNENKHNGTSKATFRNPTKSTTSKTVTGAKRANPAGVMHDDGPPKPKVARKIPDWDYKGRFHQLNEKYTQAQESIKTMKEKISGFEYIENSYETTRKEAEELAQAKAALVEKCETLTLENANLRVRVEKIQTDLNLLETSHKTLEEKATALEESNVKLTDEKEKNTKDIIRLTGSLNELTEFHDNLKKEHAELSHNHKELQEKYKLFCEENKDLLKALSTSEKKVKKLEAESEAQNNELQHLQAERRRLHNVIQDLKGNIRVFCRVRPPISSAEIDLLQCSITFVDNNGLDIRKSRESVSQITGKPQETKGEFTFDRVFSTESTQEEVFEDLAQLVQSALDGYNVCVFAYGQTGSGKTYTMQGGNGSPGMIPRTIDLIFKNIEELNKSGWKYNVQASFLEIYNENIRDLLNINNSQKLEIYHNEGKGTTVTNLTIQPMDSAVELKQYMTLAHRNRATAATDFNEHSSRSHAVTKIYLEGTLEDQNIVLKGSINLVDLAGSESAKTTVNDERLTETKNINRSLATLGDVISALYCKSKHIPYRNSKLTYLLQSSLGGNSKTLMVVNVAPFEECFNESISSLRFAAKVKEVKTGSKRNKMALSQPAMKF
ncbi:carboxy-terminal kinesin 2 [Sitophilus oryzae]|uniref:Kinesin-like protein n=1 Tax=Sitophilus oryzae TaxID=7048 RepID=A0A6J2YJM4_SITOR|nr:carboxy-terminal kinesin 2 [Sitophilus oryzae]